MQIKVYRNDVIDGLQKSSGIIPAKTGAAFLRTIWLRAEGQSLQILSTDSSLEFTGQYPAQVDQPGLAGVQGKSFYELVRKLPPGEIGMKLDGETGNLLITQGSRRYKLPVSDASWFQNFSAFPAEGAVLWSGDYLQEIIDRVSFCISDEDTMEAMACMFMKPEAQDSRVEVCGLNGHQFALAGFMNDDVHGLLPSEGALIQKKYVAELKKWLTSDEIEMSISQKRLFFRTAPNNGSAEGQKSMETFSLPLSYYQYPDYKNFVSKLDGEEVSELIVDRQELGDALERVAIFNTDNNRCAYFMFDSPGLLSLQSQGQEAGEAMESMEASFTGDLKKIAFPTRDINEILTKFSSAKVKLTLTGAEGPCGVTGDKDEDYLVIIMPMKIVEETYYSEEDI